jgi:DNA modification methylase
MTEGLIRHVAAFERSELDALADARDTYLPTVRLETPAWLGSAAPAIVVDAASGRDWVLYNADSAEVLPALPAASVDLSVYSPPFASLYVYSPSDRDLGNAANRGEFWTHYGFIIREMLRLTKPGRLTAVHVMNIAKTLGTHGVIGIEDFRGDTIRAYEAAGWIFHAETAIQKNPQAAAIRTHAKGLLFKQLNTDAAAMRPTLLDYLLCFRKPGDNAVPVKTDLTHEEWIAWAHGIWLGIKESDTLNVGEGRDADDERHICALQLGVIERCIRLWSNPGEVILTPFAGIGSEVHEAVRLGRRGVGIELKGRYFRTAVMNLRRVEASTGARTLFDFAADSSPPEQPDSPSIPASSGRNGKASSGSVGHDFASSGRG